MTQLTKMSITRALATLKAQKEEISKYFANRHVFMGFGTGVNGKTTCITGLDKTQVASHIQGEKDKIDGMIRRQVTIKNAINLSNQNTKVTVSGKEMSVAEAILLKGTLEMREKLLKSMRDSYTSVTASYKEHVRAFDERVDVLAKGAYPVDATAEQIAAIQESTRETQLKIHEVYLIDPLNLVEAANKLEEENSFLRTELDYVLSMSNTTTEIDVEM